MVVDTPEQQSLLLHVIKKKLSYRTNIRQEGIAPFVKRGNVGNEGRAIAASAVPESVKI